MVVASNLFMNGVDRVDQIRWSYPIRRNGAAAINEYSHVVLVFSIHQYISLFKKIAGSKATKVKLCGFKRRVAEQLTALQRAKLEKERHCKSSPRKPIADVVGVDDSLPAINQTQESIQLENLRVTCLHCAVS